MSAPPPPFHHNFTYHYCPHLPPDPSSATNHHRSSILLCSFAIILWFSFNFEFLQENDKKYVAKVNSDSEEEEQDNEHKEKGVSNKSYIEKEDSKKLKQKQREIEQPKMGKMDIGYQVLHDAFFKHQTEPKLTEHGDFYYEGKEFEVDLMSGHKSDKVDVTLAPEDLEVMENVPLAKYEEAREEEKLVTQDEDFNDMVAENEKKRNCKMQEKDTKLKFQIFGFSPVIQFV